uniref:Uncharacterized protein n=1 Tax=Solanum lycopersicum TaxID=4081 RepID=A0A3Q7EDY4_SOLLC
MEGRRVRRFGRWRSNQTLLPVRVNRLSNAVSCWYCDCKSSILNEPLFRFGRRYSRFLKAWFSMGVGFSLAVLFAVTMILLYEIVQILCLYYGNTQMSNVMNKYLFGFSSTPCILIVKGWKEESYGGGGIFSGGKVCKTLGSGK